MKSKILAGLSRIAAIAAAPIAAGLQHLKDSTDAENLKQRTETLKSLTSEAPAVVLNGAQRRRLFNLRGINLSASPQDEHKKYQQTPAKPLQEKVTRKLLTMPIRRLNRLPARTATQVKILEGRIARGTSREKRLLAPRLESLKVWQDALTDVIEFRTMKRVATV